MKGIDQADNIPPGTGHLDIIPFIPEFFLAELLNVGFSVYK
jgi:hypothetical protein